MAESRIFISSDLHLMHNKEFIYKERGFTSLSQHDNTIINRFNTRLTDDDILILLGDLMVCGKDNSAAIELLKKIKGKFLWIKGNHDTDNRVKQVTEALGDKLLGVTDAYRFKYGKVTFYCSHYPTLVNNYDDHNQVFCLHGHTHSDDPYEYIMNCCYNCAVDAHTCYPILIDEIYQDLMGLKAGYDNTLQLLKQA